MKQQLCKVLVLVLGLALFGAVPEAYACSSPPVVPSITVVFHEICVPLNDPTDCMIRAWITVHNYTTFGSSTSPGGFCACAFKKVGGIKSIEWVNFVDPTTGQRFPAWSFDQNTNTAASAASFLNTVATNVDGFLAQTCQNVPRNTPLDLMFEVLLKKNTTVAQVSSALAASPSIVTGGASAAGTLDDHVATLPPKGTEPTCSVQSKSVAYVGEGAQTMIDRGLGASVSSNLISCKLALAKPSLVLSNNAVVEPKPVVVQPGVLATQ